MPKAKATTPCPACGKPVPVEGERGACRACGQKVRFVDVPESPCAACGEPVALRPGAEAVRCGACGAWQAAEEGRATEAWATCPRCRRDVQVPLRGEVAVCPRCGAALALADTL